MLIDEQSKLSDRIVVFDLQATFKFYFELSKSGLFASVRNSHKITLICILRPPVIIHILYNS